MQARLILFRQGQMEFVVIETTGKAVRDLEDEYGATCVAVIDITGNVGAFPTDRLLCEEP